MLSLSVLLLTAYCLLGTPLALAQGAPANTLLTNGGDSGVAQSADSPGDTFVTGIFIGSYAASNSTSVAVSTGYAVTSLSQPADQTALSAGTTLFFSCTFRNGGNATDYFTISTQIVLGEIWKPYLVWPDSVTAVSQPVSLEPESTCYFLLAVPVPPGASDLSSSTVSFTVKDQSGSGANDNWPAYGFNNDTASSTIRAALAIATTSPPPPPPPLSVSTLTLVWVTPPPIVLSSETLTLQWHILGGSLPYSAKVAHTGRSSGKVEETPSISADGYFSVNLAMDYGENIVEVTLKDSTPSLKTVTASTSIFRGEEMSTSARVNECKVDISVSPSFYRTIINPETNPIKIEVTNGMKVSIPEGTFSGFAMVQVKVGAEFDKVETLRKAASGLSLIAGNEANMINIDVMGTGGKLQPSRFVTLVIPYTDPTPGDPNDDFGFRVAYYDESAGTWKVAGKNAVVDPVNDTVTVNVDHFTLFATANARGPAPDFSNFIVYPNPFRPNSGDSRKGKEYSLADQESGIIFDGLTEGAKIQIFSVMGEKVRELVTPSGTSRMRWDVKNEDGDPAVSGIYFYMVTDNAGRKVTGKIAIIR